MYINRTYGLSEYQVVNASLGTEVPTNPAQPYVQFFRGENFDGPSAVLTAPEISPLPKDWHMKISSLIVNGDWTFLAHTDRASKRAKNPDAIAQLSTGRYNGAALKALRLYDHITAMKLVSAPTAVAAPGTNQPQVSPAQTIPSQTTVTPTAQPATVQYQSIDTNQSVSPAPTLPPFGLSFLAGADWQKWAAIAVVVGTVYTIMSNKGKRHATAR